ncbi:hypothetical protein AB6A40_006564 [Gnathostoma spinigerum]|uniref:Integrase catalytic domain-containing protein n=1 Tax=Gnathostoma spinigerum TaxID=75299 RepID=A0ABD6EJX3_9BILA
MVEMESSGYGSRCYNMALIVTDLFSHFVFGRALAEAPDSSLLVRHLMDIFGAFAPPEAYRTYSNHLIIEHVMSDIEKLFKIPIRNIGPGVMSHYTLRANIYRRAEEELGSRERWVEALPFAVIEYNQKPLDDLAMRISPFEIMFGRRPWKDCITPPWIENIDGDTLFEVNGSEGSMNGQGSVYDVLACDTARRSGSDNSLQSNQTNFGELSENRAKIALATPQSQAKYNEHGQLIDPGTGYLFDAGDHVYMRNLAFSEALNKRRNHVPRYLRATIAEVDLSNADFTYRVYYWNEVPNVDSVPPDVWPTEECISTWVSPFDVTASTPELARKRSVVKRRELLSQCKCGYDYCELQYSDLCPFKLSQSCCKRLNVNCACHMNIGKHQEKERQALCEDQMQEDHAKETLWNVTQEDQKKEGPFTLELNIEEPRWIFLNGRLVEYIPKCCKRKRREPQEIDEINEAEVKECQNEESDSATSQSDDELQSEIEGKSARVVPFQSLIHQQKRKCVIGSMSLKHISRDSARIPSYARAQVARAARVHEVARNGANETSESQKPRKQPMEHCSSLYGRVEAANISPKKLERRKRSPSRASHITQRFSPSPNHH